MARFISTIAVDLCSPGKGLRSFDVCASNVHRVLSACSSYECPAEFQPFRTKKYTAGFDAFFAEWQRKHPDWVRHQDSIAVMQMKSEPAPVVAQSLLPANGSQPLSPAENVADPLKQAIRRLSNAVDGGGPSDVLRISADLQTLTRLNLDLDVIKKNELPNLVKKFYFWSDVNVKLEAQKVIATWKRRYNPSPQLQEKQGAKRPVMESGRG